MAAAFTLPAFADQINPVIEALAIAIGRPAGAAVVLPVFTRAQIGTTVKGAFALALSLVAVPPVLEALRATSYPAATLAVLEGKEVLIGVIIGALIGIPIWSVQVAGEILDTQRSATQDRQQNPGTGDQDSTTSAFLAMTVIALFVMSGGLVVLARTIDESYAVWPPLALLPLPTHGWATFLLGALDGMFRAGLALAAPVVLGMLLCDGCVILLMRSVPKLHMYDLAPTLRNLLFVLLMFAYVGFLVVYMRRDIDRIADVATSLRVLLP